MMFKYEMMLKWRENKRRENSFRLEGRKRNKRDPFPAYYGALTLKTHGQWVFRGTHMLGPDRDKAMAAAIAIERLGGWPREEKQRVIIALLGDDE